MFEEESKKDREERIALEDFVRSKSKGKKSTKKRKSGWKKRKGDKKMKETENEFFERVFHIPPPKEVNAIPCAFFEDLFWEGTNSKNTIDVSNIDDGKSHFTKVIDRVIESTDFEFGIKAIGDKDMKNGVGSAMIGIVGGKYNTGSYIGNDGRGWSWYSESYGYSRSHNGSGWFYGDEVVNLLMFFPNDVLYLRVNRNQNEIYFRKNKSRYVLLMDNCGFQKDEELRIAWTGQCAAELVHFKDLTVLSIDEDSKERTEYLIQKMMNDENEEEMKEKNFITILHILSKNEKFRIPKVFFSS